VIRHQFKFQNNCVNSSGDFPEQAQKSSFREAHEEIYIAPGQNPVDTVTQFAIHKMKQSHHVYPSSESEIQCKATSMLRIAFSTLGDPMSRKLESDAITEDTTYNNLCAGSMNQYDSTGDISKYVILKLSPKPQLRPITRVFILTKRMQVVENLET
jgi:hypothetical protein